jgi:Flp pilus assembly pilin Flp
MRGYDASFSDVQQPRPRPGQGLVEYTFLILLIALVVITMLTVLGGQIGSMYNDIAASLMP